MGDEKGGVAGYGSNSVHSSWAVFGVWGIKREMVVMRWGFIRQEVGAVAGRAGAW